MSRLAPNAPTPVGAPSLVRAANRTTPAPDGAGTEAPPDRLRRVEDWLVQYLDDEPAAGSGSLLGSLRARVDSWTPVIRNATDARQPAPRAAGKGTEAASGWSKLRLAQNGSVTTVRFRDSRLLREDDLRLAAEELNRLATAGYHRMVLNFGGVERISSQFVGAVAAAHRRCTSSEGGQLRLCGLRPELAPLFTITGLAASIPIFSDESEALQRPWPAKPPLRPLPVALLAGLQAMGPIFAAEASDRNPAPADAGSRAGADPRPLRLVARTGKQRGRVIPISTGPFVIGRDPGAQLRVEWPTISRRHAQIERVDGRWVVTDLGTTNGTGLGARLLKGQTAELNDGDRLSVGPLHFAVCLGTPGVSVEDQAADWLRDESDEDDEADGGDSGKTIEADLPWTTEVIERVLVVRPSDAALSDPARLDALRTTLAALAETDLPRRVVIDLDRVGMLSSRAVALVLAHLLRLDRAGGSLRLCRPSVGVQALLDRIGLPALIDVHPTLEAAVLTAWD